MHKVRATPVPQDALLQRYVVQGGCYTDCFQVNLLQSVDLPELVTAFYTTWLFRMERAVLALALQRRISDSNVVALAQDHADSFAAWRVEARSDDQIMLCDVRGATRSYLAATPAEGGGTTLLFGSAVVPRGGDNLGRLIKLTVPLHRFYSWALFATATRKLRKAADQRKTHQ